MLLFPWPVRVDLVTIMALWEILASSAADLGIVSSQHIAFMVDMLKSFPDGNVAVQGADYMPTCLWIDANGDQPATGFQVNWLDMQVQASDNRTDKNVDDVPTLCNTPSFTIYNNPDPNTISYWTGNRRRSFDHSKVAKAEGPPSKHSESQPQRRGQFSQRFDNVLVIDDTSEHSAQQLCESETSAGPDFVNSGEMFCDMKTKTAYPLCNNSNNEAVYPHTNTTLTQCFDLKTKMLS